MNREAWHYNPRGLKELDTTEPTKHRRLRKRKMCFDTACVSPYPHPPWKRACKVPNTQDLYNPTIGSTRGETASSETWRPHLSPIVSNINFILENLYI